jgi:septal ring factor EnvC (AmiA/AmiB activator)/phage tail protein X
MRKISLWLLILTFIAALARAQDATQQQLDQISGKIQDLQASLAEQGKRIDALEKKIGDLQDKLNQPGASVGASADDLKKLAEQVQEIDKKRQADNEQILKELEKLDKSLGVAPSGHKPTPSISTNNPTPPAADGKQNGYYYPIKSGDTLSAIAKAYRDSDKHVKVTADDILKANPGLNPKNMVVGKKIFIPDPNAK